MGDFDPTLLVAAGVAGVIGVAVRAINRSLTEEAAKAAAKAAAEAAQRTAEMAARRAAEEAAAAAARAAATFVAIGAGVLIYKTVLKDEPPPLKLKGPPDGKLCGIPDCKDPQCNVSKTDAIIRMKQLCDRYQIDPEKYHFALAGSGASGKSTLRNRLCRIWDDKSDHASPTIAYGEGTTQVTSMLLQSNPALPHVVVVDLPGIGTGNAKQHGFFFDHACFAYDLLIIVVPSRWDENIIHLASEAERWGISWIAVVSKSDLLLTEKVHETVEVQGRTMEECMESAKVAVRIDVERERILHQHLKDKRMFIINSKYTLRMAEYGNTTGIPPPKFSINCKEADPEMDEGEFLKHIATVAKERRDKEKTRKCQNSKAGENHDPSEGLYMSLPCEHVICHGCYVTAQKVCMCLTSETQICRVRVTQFEKLPVVKRS